MRIEEIVSMQELERYKCFILCGEGLTGKTRLARRVHGSMGGSYYDFLGILEADKNLREKVETIGPRQLFNMIDDESCKFIIADHLDIVFSLWVETKQKEFLRILDKKSNGSCIMVILHNYKLLEEENVLEANSRGIKRIFNISEVSY